MHLAGYTYAAATLPGAIQTGGPQAPGWHRLAFSLGLPSSQASLPATGRRLHGTLNTYTGQQCILWPGVHIIDTHQAHYGQAKPYPCWPYLATQKQHQAYIHIIYYECFACPVRRVGDGRWYLRIFEYGHFCVAICEGRPSQKEDSSNCFAKTKKPWDKKQRPSPVPEWSTSSKAHIAVCWEALKNGFIWVNWPKCGWSQVDNFFFINHCFYGTFDPFFANSQ